MNKDFIGEYSNKLLGSKLPIRSTAKKTITPSVPILIQSTRGARKAKTKKAQKYLCLVLLFHFSAPK